MGRAIVRNPQVFLFDEPLSNLDAKLRVQMRIEIKELHQRLKTTTVYVTHDQIEAMTMADKIVVMHDGLVEQIGAPLDLYDRPNNLFVAGFIGSPAMNMIEGQVSPSDPPVFVTSRRRRPCLWQFGRCRERQSPWSMGFGRSMCGSIPMAFQRRSWSPNPPGPRPMSSPGSAATILPSFFTSVLTAGPGETLRIAINAPRSMCSTRRLEREFNEVIRRPVLVSGCTGGTSKDPEMSKEEENEDQQTRSTCGVGRGLAGAAGLGLGGRRPAFAQEPSYTPEEGASLRLLRWTPFVQGDEDAWLANTKKFTEATGVEVRVDKESWEDIRPKAAVAANVGSGPDMVLCWFDDPHQYPDKLLDMTDLGTYLDGKYGGFYEGLKGYATRGDKYIALPLAAIGNAICYRQSHMEAAGFKEFPKDTAGFLELCTGAQGERNAGRFSARQGGW